MAIYNLEKLSPAMQCAEDCQRILAHMDSVFEDQSEEEIRKACGLDGRPYGKRWMAARRALLSARKIGIVLAGHQLAKYMLLGREG